MAFLSSVFDNPIFVRELRRRMRGRAIIFSLVSYVILMCAISFIVIFLNATNSSLPPQEIGQNIGQAMFYGISVIQAFLVLLAAPSITSSMTTAEREKQTFEFLQATTLSARDFVVGNLLSTFMYVLIVLVCAMPVISVTFLYGGISIDDVLTTFGILLAISLLLTCFALLASSVNTKTRSIQALVTIVCVIAGIFTISTRILFAGFRATGGIPMFLRPVTVLGMTVPSWIPLAIPFLTFCAVLIIAAGRKLYEPDNRFLNYRQFLVIFSIFNTMFLAGGDPEVWLWVSTAMVYLAAINFSTGRPFLGDETWVIKRQHPLFRRIDEGFLYMLLVLAVWAGFGAAFWTGTLTSAPLTGRPLASIVLYGCASTLLIYMIGRAISQITYTRSGAMRLTLLAVAVLFFALPLLHNMSLNMDGGPGETSFLLPFCPLYFADEAEKAIRQVATPGLSATLWNTSIFASLMMLAATVGVAVLWRTLSRRHRLSEYHFDLQWVEKNRQPHETV